MRAIIAARIFLVLITFAVAFQFALAFGAPWGALTMGGAYPGRLPAGLRIGALGSAALLVAFGAVVAARAGLALPRWHRASRRLIWVVVAYTLIGVALHVATPSAAERMLWLPVLLVLAACAVIVARSAPSAHR